MTLFLLNTVTSREGCIHEGAILHILLFAFMLVAGSSEENDHE